MKALWKGVIVAEAQKDNLIYIEGNWYFPPDAIKKEYFKPSKELTTCFWKGKASYYNIDVDGTVNEGGAWYYPAPKDDSIYRVKKDFTNYVAFWRGVEVTE
jgi:uncharacterized protein (DUF427 family)